MPPLRDCAIECLTPPQPPAYYLHIVFSLWALDLSANSKIHLLFSVFEIQSSGSTHIFTYFTCYPILTHQRKIVNLVSGPAHVLPWQLYLRNAGIGPS